MTSGEVDIVLSNPADVRLFDSSGNLLWQDGTSNTSVLRLNVSSPSGYLKGLASGNVDVWLQGMQSDPNFTFAVLYKDSQGNVLTQDSIHADIVTWNYVNRAGQPIGNVEPIWKDALLAAATASFGPLQLPDSSDVDPSSANAGIFQSEFAGLSTSQGASLTITSDSDSSDSATESLMSNGQDSFLQSRPVALYNGNEYGSTDDSEFTSAQKNQIQSALGLKQAYFLGADSWRRGAADVRDRSLS